MSDQKETFKIGICMAGAVSAGAYTAGVIDFLLEALNEWEKRKKNGDPNVPQHNIEIPVIGGASAGGMTGIITAASLNNTIVPIDKPGANLLDEITTNKLYHSWVDLVDKDMLSLMLKNDDIEKDKKIYSGLNSKFIDSIAERVVKVDTRPENWNPLPSYFSKNLKIFTTLSNLNGYEYHVNFKANTPGKSKYYMRQHNDYACFELTETDISGDNKGWMPLNFKTGTNVSVAKDAAMATGAFPVGLRSRKLKRPSLYVNALKWLDPLQNINKINTPTHETLNVDGGLINNEPFDKVREVLKDVTGQTEAADYQNYNRFKSTVLMIDPFPSEPLSNKPLDNELFPSMGATLNAMIEHLRSKPMHLINAFDSELAGQYLIAPSRRINLSDGTVFHEQGEKAIACGVMGGFGGFLNKEFRVHDYFLGRHNCKIFLRDYFTIPAEALEKNPVFKEGFAGIDKSKFKSTVDDSYQIIPIFTEAVNFEFPNMTFRSGTNWPVIKEENMNDYRGLLKDRVQAVLMNIEGLSKTQKFFMWIGAKVLLNAKLADAALDYIKGELREWKLMKE